jgi:predicted nucleic acid-binding Zn ribbon protein
LIVGRWLQAHQVAVRLDPGSIYQRWKEVVGESIAEHTRVIGLSGGVLLVEVDSAPLLHELSTYYRRELLDSLRQLGDLPAIQEIRFRAGSL